MSEDSTDQAAPTPSEVAYRILILKFQIVHALSAQPPEVLERDITSPPAPIGERFPPNALRHQGLWDYASPSEREVFETSSTDLSERQLINISWRSESVACLAWALGLLDGLPPYDTEVEPEVVLPLIPDRKFAEFVEAAQLRSRHEIEGFREIAELWHWRSRTRQLEEEGYQQPAGQPTLDSIVRDVAPKAASEGIIPQMIDYDFPAFGKAYRDLTSDEWAKASSLATERHFALNWLSGYAPGNDWDQTPTDT